MRGAAGCAKTAGMRRFPILVLFAASLLFGALPAMADDSSNFAVWLNQFRQDADQQGLTGPEVRQALGNAQFLPRVIELDRKQPEGSMTFDEYIEKQLTDARINRGRQLYVQHRAQLNKVAAEYGVPAPYIVALWGIETNYGSNTGGFDVISSLATLAYEGRRADYFRGELVQALRILKARHVALADMKGSWAGAMGQCQFMPTSFWNYAIDGNGDGKKNIWTSLPDVFASTANYLKTEGWNPAIAWGAEVRLPPDLQSIGNEAAMPWRQWLDLGVEPVGSASPSHSQPDAAFSLVQPDGAGGRAFLVSDNFKVIKHWNRSNYFAINVGLLADRIGQ